MQMVSTPAHYEIIQITCQQRGIEDLTIYKLMYMYYNIPATYFWAANDFGYCSLCHMQRAVSTLNQPIYIR